MAQPINISVSSQENSWLKYFSNEYLSTPDSDSFNVLIIGQQKSGKSSLLKLLNSNYYESNFTVLEFLTLKAESDDSSENNINIWMLDAISDFECLSEIAITPEILKSRRFLAVFLVNLSKPYEVLDFLDEWFSYLKNRIDYNFNSSGDDENTYQFPILILGNQNDAMENVFQACAKPISTFLTFQSQIRKWALEHHASLIYISCKTGANFELFKNYLFHFCFNSPFNNSFDFDSIKSLFIPKDRDSSEAIKEIVAKVKDVDFSVPIKEYFPVENSIIANSLNYDLKYEASSDSFVKNLIQDGILQIKNNHIDNSDNLNNANLINVEIVQNLINEINKNHNPPFEQLVSFMDERIRPN